MLEAQAAQAEALRRRLRELEAQVTHSLKALNESSICTHW